MEFQPLQSDNPAVQRLSEQWIATKDETFTQESMESVFWSNISASNGSLEKPLSDGIPAKVLQENGKWQKGHVRPRVVLEFCPEENTVGVEEECS